MPGPPPTPVPSDPTLPSRTDVVVIGGGIIGASTALTLAERGHSVLLAEKGEIGAEQSSRNWGWVRLTMRDPREIPLMIKAQKIWDGLDARTGRATGYVRSGILNSAGGRGRTLVQYEDWLRTNGLDTSLGRSVSGAEFEALVPGYCGRYHEGFFAPMDGRAEPQWTTSALAEAARSAGAGVVTRCAVRSLDISAGRVAGVITEKGPVRADAVVLAGGAWSRLFAGNAGMDLPQLLVNNSVLRTSAPSGQDPGAPSVAFWGGEFSLRQHVDGGFIIAAGRGNVIDIVPDSFRLARRFLPALRSHKGALAFRISERTWTEMRRPRRWQPDVSSPFEVVRILDPAPVPRLVQKGWAAARAAFPALNGARIARSWAGLIDVTPDAVPVISAVGSLPGFYIATGFSGHGFGIGPGAGRLMADLVTGDVPVVDPAAFRLSRFFDGSPTEVIAGF